MTITCTVEDLTSFNGGVIFAYVDIGKMPPHRVKEYLESVKYDMKPICKYFEANGFTVMFLAQRAEKDKPRGTRFEVWGMNKPYDPDIYTSSMTGKDFIEAGSEIQLDVVKQAIGANKRTEEWKKLSRSWD